MDNSKAPPDTSKCKSTENDNVDSPNLKIDSASDNDDNVSQMPEQMYLDNDDNGDDDIPDGLELPEIEPLSPSEADHLNVPTESEDEQIQDVNTDDELLLLDSKSDEISDKIKLKGKSDLIELSGQINIDKIADVKDSLTKEPCQESNVNLINWKLDKNHKPKDSHIYSDLKTLEIPSNHKIEINKNSQGQDDKINPNYIEEMDDFPDDSNETNDLLDNFPSDSITNTNETSQSLINDINNDDNPFKGSNQKSLANGDPVSKATDADDDVMIITDSEDEDNPNETKSIVNKSQEIKNVEEVKEHLESIGKSIIEDVIMLDVGSEMITEKGEIVDKTMENSDESSKENTNTDVEQLDKNEMLTDLNDPISSKIDSKDIKLPSTIEQKSIPADESAKSAQSANFLKAEKESDDVIMLDDDDDDDGQEIAKPTETLLIESTKLSTDQTVNESTITDKDEIPKKDDESVSTVEPQKAVDCDDVIMLDDEEENGEIKCDEKVQGSEDESPMNLVTRAAPVPENVNNSFDTNLINTTSTEMSIDTNDDRIISEIQRNTEILKPETIVHMDTSTEAAVNTIENSKLPGEPLKELKNLVDKSYPNQVIDKPISGSNKRPIDNTQTGPIKFKRNSTDDARECVNFECSNKNIEEFFKAPNFILSHFNVSKKFSRIQYVCNECFDKATQSYSELAAALIDEQPLLFQKLPKRPDLVEILDSSDEEDCTASNKTEPEDCLSSDVLSTLQNNFDSVLSDTLSKVNVKQQMDWTISILVQKQERNEELSKEIESEFKSLQKMADNMYNKLYKNSNYVIEELPPFDLNTNKQMQIAGPSYPPFGDVEYPEPDTVSLYYAVRHKLLAAWVPCKLVEIMDGSYSHHPRKYYRVKFLRSKGMLIKFVPENHIAYGSPPNVRLQVGTRVIALFHMESPNGPSKENTRALFFPGVIAEPLQGYNRWRYLVFFDDGYAQYVSPDNIRLICGVAAQVWEDVHPDSANFIENYLTQYKTQRPMVQVRKGQRMITEWNGKWLYAKVNEIDSSLVQMYFEEGKRTEWIYRGSTRLGPLFRERQSQQLKHSVGSTKRNEPYVEYLSYDDDGKQKSIQINKQLQAQSNSILPPTQNNDKNCPPVSQSNQSSSTTVSGSSPAPKEQSGEQQQEEKRAVAKKSTTSTVNANSTTTSRPTPTVNNMNNSTIYVEEDNRPKGKVVYYTAKKHMPPRKYALHACGIGCLYEVKHNLTSYSPLAKPLLSGWERQICKNKSKKVVIYRSPCGRRLRTMAELHQYLRKTQCPLNVENFDFDYLIHCLAEYVIDSCIMQKSDISDGVENMVVPCVNYYDNTVPPPCVYSAKRIPTEGVNLILNQEFMCGCDCEDDCLDKTKCQCWQLTLAGAKFGNPNTPPDQVGYEYKRLPEPVPTGIYECNSRCKCPKTCLNRVAQQPLQMKLQVFKTGNRGWGLRCLNDVSKGSFICVYAGDLLTEQKANEAGDNFGDEYFAELDYIEVVENLKEGYEPDVVNDDEFEDEEEEDKRDTDDDEFVTKTSVEVNKTKYNTRNSDATKKKSARKENIPVNVEPQKSTIKQSEIVISDEEEERQPISFVPNTTASSFEKDQEDHKYKSIRRFYGKNEYCYIMDAKKTGNIGRYFNHSCSPNLFVQNVFVDTHDIRFPWVAFFALSHIRAGTELTWNYNYDVGSVPGKVLYCQCGSESCRGRLL